MVVGIKDAGKLIGISIISCCAVLVCTLFLNYYFDISKIKQIITSESVMSLYDAQVSTSKIICLVSGGCLFITSVIMLLFYIKHYIDSHKKELGILKAMGCSNMAIARNFWIFGTSIFIGAIAGFTGAFLLMPIFYQAQNKDKILPEIHIDFHPDILLYFVILPTAAFSIIAILYSYCRLRTPVMSLLKEDMQASSRKKTLPSSIDINSTFLKHLKKTTLSSRKTLVFFILFSSFCFSSMTQMSAAIKDMSSPIMSLMILIIGLILAYTTLFLALTTVIKGNTKTIAMMGVFGYSRQDCRKSLLDCYRPIAYIGFAIGTVYQYILIKLVVSIVFKDIEGIPTYKFSISTMLISLGLFILIYEAVMGYYSNKIKDISIKEIMLE